MVSNTAVVVSGNNPDVALLSPGLAPRVTDDMVGLALVESLAGDTPSGDGDTVVEALAAERVGGNTAEIELPGGGVCGGKWSKAKEQSWLNKVWSGLTGSNGDGSVLVNPWVDLVLRLNELVVLDRLDESTGVGSTLHVGATMGSE